VFDPRSFKGVLFDLDGTLVDSAPDLVGACNRVLKVLDRPPITLENGRRWIGHGARQLLERAITGKVDGKAPGELLDEAYQHFLQFYGEAICLESKLYPAIIQTLSSLQESGHRLACVTNKPAAFTRPLLDAFDLSGYFDPIVSGDDLARKKPDPLPLQYVLDQWHLSANDCLMVGDSESDCSAALACGMPVVLVSYGYSQGRNLAALGPDAVIDSIGEILTLSG